MKYEVVQNPSDLQQAFKLRQKVFVDEQKVPVSMELDESDHQAIHVIAKDDNQVVGTGRMVIDGNRGRIGRVAVDKLYRRQGIGEEIMKTLELQALALELKEIYLHAQIYVQKFYEKLGYYPRGSIFVEANIEHLEMYKKLQPQRP